MSARSTRLGVHLIEDATARRITSEAVVLSDGRAVVFDPCLVAVSFTAPDRSGETFTIDGAYVRGQVESLASNADLSRFIL